MTGVEPADPVLVDTVDLASEKLAGDPFGEYSRIRERPGLTRGVLPGLAPLWLVTRHEHVSLVMSDPRFVNDVRNIPGNDGPSMLELIRRASGTPAEYLKFLGPNLSDVDGADHARLRKHVSRALTARTVLRLQPRIEEITGNLLDALPGSAQDGVVDLLAHFAYPLPITVICELIGIPESDWPAMRRWAAILATGREMGDAVRGAVDYLQELIARRRRRPADDFVSGLSHSSGHSDELGGDEIVMLILTMIVAGHETTAHLIANGTAALLTHPEQLAALRRDPGLLPNAVNELMRWCGPTLSAFMRYATEDVRLGDTLVRKGEAVMPVLVGANYDPRAFDRPHQLDVTREPGHGRATQLGFGHGPHYCPGAGLARHEAEIAVGSLLRRYPEVALAVPPADLRRGPVRGAWQLAKLPVTLGPAR
ncbi:cytochrome P450 family protein [Fodinicola acaciae]|uniref:cytochrome P450 family protein n=1 Tax=Fodinicola acaciae TaxID=2681555 RepID=UPI0013D75C4C|nr:cytochrome P450 [Fodinicola acaciae]